VYIIAGAEFGDLEGHTLVIFKALYGLWSSGLHWHECFADCLQGMGFTPSKVEPDIWMHLNGDAYEYIGVYVDDLAIIAKNPGEIAVILQTKYNFKLKGTGPITFHLGMDFFRDSDGVLCIAARKYVEKMVMMYAMCSTLARNLVRSFPRHLREVIILRLTVLNSLTPQRCSYTNRLLVPCSERSPLDALISPQPS